MEESFAEPVEGGLGVCALEFEHMAHEFVRKPDIVVFHVGKLVAVLVLAERNIGAGQHLQRFSVHDHEFHFDAEAFPDFKVAHDNLSSSNPFRAQDDVSLIIPKVFLVLDELVLRGVHALLDAVAQAPHDGEVELLLAHEVLDAVVDTRVVVHLDHDRVAVDFFEVHAVEPVTDEA